MADTFLGLARGGAIESISISSSTTGRAIELRVNDTITVKSEVIQALEKLKADIIQTNNLPFA